MADDADVDNVGGMDGENPFHTDAVADTADGKGFGEAASVAGNDGTLKHLDTLLGALLDVDADGNGIAHFELGHGFLQLLAVEFFDRGHKILPIHRSFIRHSGPAECPY